MKILVLDNYDSFVYNLVHIIRELGYGKDMAIYRNDKIAVKDVAAYDKILLSPGPGIPSEAGIMPELIKEYADKKSILGVCLGHQALAEHFGARLVNLDEVVHGMSTTTRLLKQDDYLFKGLPETFETARYHSWAVEPESVPDTLEVTATSDKESVMGIRHKDLDLRGLQFHPESILTEHGKIIMENWLKK